MVFAALDDAVLPLADYLGRCAPLIHAATSQQGTCRHHWSGKNPANWKLCYEVTLDDYHVQFMHPESIGDTAIPAWSFLYGREGLHSHMLRRKTSDWTFSGFWEGLERNEYEYAGYKIHHLFPATFLVVEREALLVTSFSPVLADRTAVEGRLFQLVGDAHDSAFWDAAARN